jgi:hypothetical protein
MVRSECLFGDVLHVHQQLMVTIAEVPLGEVVRTLELV